MMGQQRNSLQGHALFIMSPVRTTRSATTGIGVVLAVAHHGQYNADTGSGGPCCTNRGHDKQRLTLQTVALLPHHSPVGELRFHHCWRMRQSSSVFTSFGGTSPSTGTSTTRSPSALSTVRPPSSPDKRPSSAKTERSNNTG